MEQPKKPKPRLRGVVHQWSSLLAVAGWVWLVAIAQTPRARVAAFVYGASITLLFVVSAVYHRPMWSPQMRARLKRLDHATIFVFIAGTYTPISLLALEPRLGVPLLAVAWAAAALGVLRVVLWPRAPRVVVAGLYVLVGWLAVPLFPALLALGPVGFSLMLAGGLVYSAGAAVYALKRPDPAPAVFGYHEIFHVMVTVAAVCHFVVVHQVIR